MWPGASRSQGGDRRFSGSALATTVRLSIRSETLLLSSCESPKPVDTYLGLPCHPAIATNSERRPVGQPQR